MLRCPTDNALLSPEYSDPYVDQLIAGKYRVREHLGEGSWSSVYRAYQENLNRVVAIKFLKFDFIYDDESVRRFKREAVTAGKFAHKGIARCYDHGFLPNGQPYMIMEYLEGESLRDRLKRTGPLDIFVIVDMLIQMCDALDVAHKQGVLHRDIKPANILIVGDENNEKIKLLDFGLAKILAADGDKSRALTKSGDVLGTPYYMSPEQAQGQISIDWRSDIYSLGCVFYEMWTGDVPFSGQTEYEVTFKHVNAEPPKLSDQRPAPPWMEAALARCLAKDPSRRFQSTADLAKTLLSGISAVDREHILKSRSHKRRLTAPQSKALLISLAVVAVLCSTGMLVVVLRSHRLPGLEKIPFLAHAFPGQKPTETLNAFAPPVVNPNVTPAKTVEELEKRLKKALTLQDQIDLAEASLTNLPADADSWLFTLNKSVDERKSMEYANKILARVFCEKSVIYSLTGGPAISKDNPRLCISLLEQKTQQHPDLVCLKAACKYCIGQLYRRLFDNRASDFLTEVAQMTDDDVSLYREAARRQLQDMSANAKSP
jgi:serine/threonine protein kinase